LSNQEPVKIAPAEGKLGVLIPGMGSVGTTFMAGVEAARQGLGQPYGSLTQMATVRLGKRTDGRTPLIKDFVPLASLDDIVYGGWDIYEDSAYEAASKAGVLDQGLIDQVKDPLEATKPMKAVFDPAYVRNLSGPNIKGGANHMEKAEALMQDIKDFQASSGASRLIVLWCGSTEVFHRAADCHQSLDAFEKGMATNDPNIPPSQIYAYASLKSGVPFGNGAPNLTNEIPALVDLAKDMGVAHAGKDFKTGQTLMKTIIAPGLKARMLGVRG